MRKSKSARKVDLSKLTSYDPPGVFIRIDPSIEKQLPEESEVWERISGCSTFCCQLGVDSDPRNSKVDLKPRRKYLRAALAEFASLDDAAGCDKSNGVFPRAPRILSTRDPRLHVVRLLRHANLHLTASNVDLTSRPASWEGPSGRVDFDYIVLYATDVEASIQATDQAENYDPNDLDQMVSWIDSEQMKWGIHHVVLRTAEMYVRKLLGIPI